MNIFVAKLNFNTSSERLREVFEAFGQVDSAKVIMDRETGRSKGFGFVEMPEDSEAYVAIGELNQTELDGNTIVVNKARPRDDPDYSGRGMLGRIRGWLGGRGRGGYGGGGGGRGEYGGGEGGRGRY